MRRTELSCAQCGSPTRVIRTETEHHTGIVKRRRECVECRHRITVVASTPEVERTGEKPPLSAWSASKVIRRAARATAAAAKANHGSSVTLRDYAPKAEVPDRYAGGLKADVDFS